MCGIAGAVAFESRQPFPDQDRLKAFARPLRHRGPDAHATLTEQVGRTAVTMVHYRLRIIDLSDQANQPMCSSSGRTVVVFNGEIYNYRELRDRLSSEGAGFRTQSDTEVLLVGFERWGIDALLERIDGMFAFALFDRAEEALYLARDPFGKKPCYFFDDRRHGRFLFSSDVRSIRSVADVSMDRDAFGYYLAELATPDHRSIWSGIEKLPGGHALRADANSTRKWRYWRLDYSSDNTMDRRAIVEHTGHLLERAVRKRLVADVPVAALLSGGLDSSLVVHAMARASDRPVVTYTAGFDDIAYDERVFARTLAERCGTEHHEILVHAHDIPAMHSLIVEYGEPFADPAALPTYLIAREIAKTEKVVLTGDGGDELFAGYYIYYFANKLQQVERFGTALPLARALERVWPAYRTKFLRRLLEASRRPRHALLSRGYGFSPAQIGGLLGRNGDAAASAVAEDREHARVWNEHAPAAAPLLVQLLSASMHTRLESDYLVKVDRATMFASLEARSPFLDRDLARFAATLQPAQILDRGRFKSVLEDLAAGHLPAKLLNREKHGFAVPIGEWFRGDLKTEFEERVLGGRQRLVPFDYGWIQRLFTDHCGGADHTHRLWSLYAFHVWAQDAAA